MRVRSISLSLDGIRRHAAQNVLPIADALNAAEARDDRGFLTSLYELQLSKMPTTTAKAFRPPNLDISAIAPVHIQRIFAGYWSLTVAWNKFRRDSIPLPRLINCSQRKHETVCELAFKLRWESAMSAAETIYYLYTLRHRIRWVKEMMEKSAQKDPDDLFQSTWLPVGDLFDNDIEDLPKTLEAHFFGESVVVRYVYHV